MRKTLPGAVEAARVTDGLMGSDRSYGANGLFIFPAWGLRVIASDQMGWDHVSVSCADRCPTWPEMKKIKDLFFRPKEWAMQLMPPDGENINQMPYCLHLWRPQRKKIPKPPRAMV